MKNKKYRVSRATLYNTIELLMECALVRKHQFGQNQAQYEKSYFDKQHDHVILTDTGEVIEFCDPRIQSIKQTIEETEAKQDSPADNVGLSAPGLASLDGSCIIHMPDRLEGLVNLNWQDYLSLDKPVPVVNDGHSALLGEAWLGAAKGFKNVILLTLGTGVGGAALVEGKLLRGRTGKGGHFGHTSLGSGPPIDICNCPNSLELAIGNCSVPERSNNRFSHTCLLYTSPSPRDKRQSRMPSSA